MPDTHGELLGQMSSAAPDIKTMSGVSEYLAQQ